MCHRGHLCFSSELSEKRNFQVGEPKSSAALFFPPVCLGSNSVLSLKKVSIVCASEGALVLHLLPVATTEKGKCGGQGFCLNKKSPSLWAKQQ